MDFSSLIDIETFDKQIKKKIPYYVMLASIIYLILYYTSLYTKYSLTQDIYYGLNISVLFVALFVFFYTSIKASEIINKKLSGVRPYNDWRKLLNWRKNVREGNLSIIDDISEVFNQNSLVFISSAISFGFIMLCSIFIIFELLHIPIVAIWLFLIFTLLFIFADYSQRYSTQKEQTSFRMEVDKLFDKYVRINTEKKNPSNKTLIEICYFIPQRLFSIMLNLELSPILSKQYMARKTDGLMNYLQENCKLDIKLRLERVEGEEKEKFLSTEYNLPDLEDIQNKSPAEISPYMYDEKAKSTSSSRYIIFNLKDEQDATVGLMFVNIFKGSIPPLISDRNYPHRNSSNTQCLYSIQIMGDEDKISTFVVGLEENMAQIH